MRPSALVLIAANLVPLFGVLFFDWRVLDILLLYWTESVVIGLVNILRMVVSGAKVRDPNSSAKATFFLVPFFAIHYGGFCAAHLFAITSIFGDTGLSADGSNSLQSFWQSNYWIAVFAIAASHLFSFFNNYIGGGEFREIRVQELMQRPYGRIMVMQIVVIVGAGLVKWAGNLLPMLLILVVAKIFVDLKMHSSERNKLAPVTR